MPSFKGLSKFFGSTASTAAGFAGGVAVAPALIPLVRAIENEAWSLHPDVPPDAKTMAQGVAQGQVSKADAYKWASQNGFGKPQMDALVNVANTGPALGYAFEAWRRGLLTDNEFQTALTRTGLETQWYPALKALKTRLLDPADLARGIHKGLIPDPGLLAVPAPSGTGKVNAYPVYPIDALAAAQGFGYSKDELGVLVGLQGNPMGAHEAAQATFRGTIEPVDYERAIAEGNTRNEWGPAIFEQSRAIPSPTNYVEAGIRTRITPDAMYAGAARHGMTHEDTDLLFAIHGRPATPHQVLIGLRRGGVYNGPTDHIDPAVIQSMRDANLRPEYYNLVAAGLELYPPLFQLNNLVKAKAVDPETARTWAYKTGEAEEVLTVLLAFWQGTPATAAGKTLTRAELRAALKAGSLTDAQVLTRLEAQGLTAPDAQLVLDGWKA